MIQVFDDCTSENSFVNILLVLGIIQWLVWFYQLLTYPDANLTNLTWLVDNNFFSEFPFIILFPIIVCFACSLIYGGIFFLALIIYFIKIPLESMHYKYNLFEILVGFLMGIFFGGCFGPLGWFMVNSKSTGDEIYFDKIRPSGKVGVIMMNSFYVFLIFL